MHSEDWAAATLGGGVLRSVGGIASLGIAGSAEAFTVGEPSPYRAGLLRVEPEARLEFPAATIRLYGTGALGRSRVRVIDSFIRDTRLGPIRVDVGTTMDTNLWAGGGGLSVEFPAGAARPRLGLEVVSASAGAFRSGFAGLEVRTPSGGAVQFEVRAWDTPAGWETEASGGVRLPFGGRGRAEISGGRYGPDPLLDSPVGSGLTAAVGWRLTDIGAPPAGLYSVGEGDTPVVRFELPDPGANEVAVTGEFNEWAPMALRLEGRTWVGETVVEPGVYRFGFLVDGEWRVPADAPGAVEDEWGRLTATLFVRRP
ncbi:MAG: glycogen-binding domain-containing protein [Gemmatimonadota bacterium]